MNTKNNDQGGEDNMTNTKLTKERKEMKIREVWEAENESLQLQVELH